MQQSRRDAIWVCVYRRFRLILCLFHISLACSYDISRIVHVNFPETFSFYTSTFYILIIALASKCFLEIPKSEKIFSF